MEEGLDQIIPFASLKGCHRDLIDSPAFPKSSSSIDLHSRSC